ncbi:LysR family transcriptional regulator [Pseudooceanicola aestuarii]|uniref:LysR family transcriptional regulator n=1 Tax=Pseudooceanicola aestuarii TaxID=2697319 RepID=UPI0013D50A3E|nr:LysR family transcriptional regulator [Pseudooceanicola aestuarii]
MINLTAGQYFLHVARFGSIRLAAERLHVSPSAISRQVVKLEHEFEEQLLERRAEGVRLTEAGRVLADHLAVIFDRIDVAKGEIADLRDLKAGTVSIATVEGITDPFMSTHITEFRNRHPGIEFHVRIRGRERVLEAVEQHLSQIGFVYDHFSHEAIETVGQWRQPLLALAPPSHPLTDGRRVTLADLADLPCVLPDSSFGIHHLLNRAFTRIGRSPRPIVVADQFHFLITHAIRNTAIIYLPLQAVMGEVTSGKLVPLNLDSADFEHRFIYAVVRRGQVRSPACEAFIASILSVFAEGEKSDAAFLARIRAAQG